MKGADKRRTFPAPAGPDKRPLYKSDYFCFGFFAGFAIGLIMIISASFSSFRPGVDRPSLMI